MNVEDITQLCQSLPAVTQDIKWEHDLVFSVGGKMFCAVGIDDVPPSASFKVADDAFETIINLPHFQPAPYVARFNWVSIDDIDKLPKLDWEKYIKQSYTLVKEKLPNKLKKELGLD